MPMLTVGEAARALGCSPKLISDWLYIQKLDASKCPMVSGRRQIPSGYLPTIANLLQERRRSA